MPTQKQKPNRIATGLHLTANRSHLPEGSLLEAQNIFIDRDGVIGKARGVNRYNSVAFTNTAVTLGEFNNTLLVHDGTVLRYDSDGAGTFLAVTGGTFTAPVGAVRARFREALLALFFTSTVGVRRLATLTGTVREAGLQQGLDMQLTLINPATGWFPADRQVAHRVLYTRSDENDQEIAGRDSRREVITNPSGGTQDNVRIVTTIPDRIIAGDFLNIYRTKASASATTDPGDVYRRVLFRAVTSAEITAATITFDDTLDEDFLDFEEPLVTNADEEGPAQEDSQPPLCLDIANYKNVTFFSNTSREHTVEIQFISTTGIVTGTDTITITDGTVTRTYTFEAAENIGAQEFQLFTTGNLGVDVRDTMKSLVRVANRDTGQSIWYLHYVSGFEDAPGKIIIRRRDLADTALSVIATASAGTNFQPALPTSGTSVASDNERTANRLAYSKPEQPDSVPRANFFDVGEQRDGIVRILNLRDSLMIMTERRVFRLSGEDAASFNITELDPSTRIRAAESAVVLNNAVYMYSSQGVVRISEDGVAIVSRRIEFELNKIIEIANFDTLTFGVAYEEERQYWLFTPIETTDTFPTRAWVYNFVSASQPWTQRLKNVSHGIVLKGGDRIFLSHAQDMFVLQERKSFQTSEEDFMDESLAITIDVVSTTTDASGATVSLLDITYTYANADLDIGFFIEQGAFEARIFAFTELTTTTFRVTMDRLSAWTVAAGTISLGIPSLIAWAPETNGDPSLLKQFSRAQIYFQRDRSVRSRVGFVSDIIGGDPEFTSQILNGVFGFGLGVWGADPWGDTGLLPSTILRVVVPRDHQKCRGLSVFYEHKLAKASFLIDQMALQIRSISERTDRGPR